jgi:hypothetical protein
MDDNQKLDRFASAIRWIARMWSVITIGLVFAFLIGEQSYPGSLVEWLAFLFFPFGICLGLVVAWWREGRGAIIVITSLLIFYAISLATTGSLPRGWAWEAFAAPGFLFGLYWYRLRRVGPPAA